MPGAWGRPYGGGYYPPVGIGLDFLFIRRIRRFIMKLFLLFPHNCFHITINFMFSSKPPIDYSYQYLEKTRQDAYTEVYKYRYKIADGDEEYRYLC